MPVPCNVPASTMRPGAGDPCNVPSEKRVVKTIVFDACRGVRPPRRHRATQRGQTAPIRNGVCW
jgi:hypothetical protein